MREGHRALTQEMVRSAVDALDLKVGPARAVLSIATLKPGPLVDAADHRLDWIDGDSDFAKRRPSNRTPWRQLQADIEAAPGRLPVGTTAVSITGGLRLAPAFLVGTAFRMVTGADLAIMQGVQLWSTKDPYDSALVPGPEEHSVGQRDELAVAMATDPTEDVLTYLHEQTQARHERSRLGRAGQNPPLSH
ncbi:hypothetical protein GCM10023205_73990 [Yinghuangia aomiensis]|uniref:Uncharacterized protein n=1 Tax=Yinghuangia aomiensis TaxID=676205 RepID=A0ABP9I816_9ACTN